MVMQTAVGIVGVMGRAMLRPQEGLCHVLEVLPIILLTFVGPTAMGPMITLGELSYWIEGVSVAVWGIEVVTRVATSMGGVMVESKLTVSPATLWIMPCILVWGTAVGPMITL